MLSSRTIGRLTLLTSVIAALALVACGEREEEYPPQYPQQQYPQQQYPQQQYPQQQPPAQQYPPAAPPPAAPPPAAPPAATGATPTAIPGVEKLPDGSCQINLPGMPGAPAAPTPIPCPPGV